MTRAGAIAAWGRLWVWLWLAGCASTPTRAPIPCGQETCGPEQLCAVISSGQTCDGGGFQILREYCIDRPASCGDTVSCNCISACALPEGGSRPCLMIEDNSIVSCGCF